VLYCRLIADNPYRLLAIGSSAPYRELRARALSAEKAARVGLAPEAGLAGVFGAGRLDECPSIVRSLANDRVALTAYRLAWMLEYPLDGARDESLAGLCNLVNESLSGTTTYRHLRFLLGWGAFIQAPGPATLDQALSLLAGWYEDAAFDEHFAALLAREDGDIETARSVHYEAQGVLIDHLLDVACTHAEDRWNAGDTTGAIALLRCVRESRLDDDAIHRALKGVAGLAERDVARIEGLCRSFGGWTIGSAPYDPREVRPLLELSAVLTDYLPAAALWRAVAERRVVQVAAAMRSTAIDLANDRSDYSAARRILEQTRELPLSDEWRRRVAQDLQTLSDIEEGTRGRAMEPVHWFARWVVGRVLAVLLLGVGALVWTGIEAFSKAVTSGPLPSAAASSQAGNPTVERRQGSELAPAIS
jgi:hypothetical protein